jgi:hypothetical protein
VFDYKYYFLSVESMNDKQITLCARSKVMDEKEKKSIKITKVVVVKGDEFNQQAHAIVKEAMHNKIKRKMLLGTMEEILSS